MAQPGTRAACLNLHSSAFPDSSNKGKILSQTYLTGLFCSTYTKDVYIYIYNNNFICFSWKTAIQPLQWALRSYILAKIWQLFLYLTICFLPTLPEETVLVLPTVHNNFHWLQSMQSINIAEWMLITILEDMDVLKLENQAHAPKKLVL